MTGTPGRRTAAGAAQPLRLYRRTADAEARRFRRLRQHGRYILVLHFDHPAALAANQELRGVGVALAVGVIRGASGDTADKRRQPLNPVHQALFEQEIERAVDRWRRRATPRLPQSIEQLIRTCRRRRIEDQAKHVPAQFRQLGTTMLADSLRPIEQGLGPP